MNIEEDFAVAAACSCCQCSTKTNFKTNARFLSVLAMTIQKQTEILRDKTPQGVPCDSTLSKTAATLHQVSSAFETLAISRRQLH